MFLTISDFPGPLRVFQFPLQFVSSKECPLYSCVGDADRNVFNKIDEFCDKFYSLSFTSKNI